MAWTIKRKNVFYIGWRDGTKDRYESARTTDPLVAERKRLEKELAQTITTGQVEAPMPLMDFDSLVGLYKKEADISSKTVRINTYSWNKFKDFLKGKPIGQITTGLIIEFRDRLLDDDASPASISIYLRDLNKLLGFAVDKGLLKSNPCKKAGSRKWAIEHPDQEDTYRFLTEAEEAKLLSVCNPLLKRMVTVALETGLRISQVVDMEWKRFDIKEHLYVVPKQKRQKARHIPLFARCLEAMGTPKMSGRVFLGTNVDQIEKMFARAVNNAEIGGECTFHDLRHTFVSRVCKLLTPIEVRDLMGWSSVALVDRYAHSRVTDIQSKMRRHQVEPIHPAA